MSIALGQCLSTGKDYSAQFKGDPSSSANYFALIWLLSEGRLLNCCLDCVSLFERLTHFTGIAALLVQCWGVLVLLL